MTDKAKLQQLFEAALKDSSDLSGGTPHRAFPAPTLDAKPTPAASPELAPKVDAPTPAPVATTVPAIPNAPTVVCNEPAPVASAPMPVTPEIDAAASEEMNAILDEKARKAKRRNRIQAMVTAGVLLASAGGGSAWFVQSPERVQALNEAIRDIRSVGDVETMVAKFQAALDRISVRGSQIDQATAAMGVTASAEDEKDPYMNAEMKELMRGEGKTIGERNSAMVQNFGHMEKEHGEALAKTKTELKPEDTFEW